MRFGPPPRISTEPFLFFPIFYYVVTLAVSIIPQKQCGEKGTALRMDDGGSLLGGSLL